MDFFEHGDSGDDAHYCSEQQEMAWMRKTRIRTFMQMELEAYLDEIDRMIRYHNCEALNCPQEEYPPRPLPIPPGYIDNLQSRLVKVMKGILLPTLRMILKTYYNLPAHQAPVTSPAVQPDDMMGPITRLFQVWSAQSFSARVPCSTPHAFS